NAMREQRAPWTPVAAEKPKPKDLVDVIIATRENGEAKDPQPYQFVLGEGRAIPDVEERIMALTPGESVDATVRFPDDFAEEAKRGQTREIQLTLREVKRQELPALDDALARGSSMRRGRKPSGSVTSRGAAPRRRCSPISCRSPPWSRRDNDEREPHLSAVHHRALQPRRAHL